MARLLYHVLHQIGQFEQAPGVQRRAARRHLHECVSLHEISPNCGNLAQMATIIVKVHVALGENTPVLYEIKLLAIQRVKGMRDPNSAAFFSRDGCNREVIERRDRRAAPVPAPSVLAHSTR